MKVVEGAEGGDGQSDLADLKTQPINEDLTQVLPMEMSMETAIQTSEKNQEKQL